MVVSSFETHPPLYKRSTPVMGPPQGATTATPTTHTTPHTAQPSVLGPSQTRPQPHPQYPPQGSLASPHSAASHTNPFGANVLGPPGPSPTSGATNPFASPYTNNPYATNPNVNPHLHTNPVPNTYPAYPPSHVHTSHQQQQQQQSRASTQDNQPLPPPGPYGPPQSSSGAYPGSYSATYPSMPGGGNSHAQIRTHTTASPLSSTNNNASAASAGVVTAGGGIPGAAAVAGGSSSATTPVTPMSGTSEGGENDLRQMYIAVLRPQLTKQLQELVAGLLEDLNEAKKQAAEVDAKAKNIALAKSYVEQRTLELQKQATSFRETTEQYRTWKSQVTDALRKHAAAVSATGIHDSDTTGVPTGLQKPSHTVSDPGAAAASLAKKLHRHSVSYPIPNAPGIASTSLGDSFNTTTTATATSAHPVPSGELRTLPAVHLHPHPVPALSGAPDGSPSLLPVAAPRHPLNPEFQETLDEDDDTAAAGLSAHGGQDALLLLDTAPTDALVVSGGTPSASPSASLFSGPQTSPPSEQELTQVEAGVGGASANLETASASIVASVAPPAATSRLPSESPSPGSIASAGLSFEETAASSLGLYTSFGSPLEHTASTTDSLVLTPEEMLQKHQGSMIEPANALANQLLTLVAQDVACSDIQEVLQDAMKGQLISMQAFLKEVTETARTQFRYRAGAAKIDERYTQAMQAMRR